MSDGSVHTGGCLCEGVRYQVHGGLADVVVCHCSQCRKTSGHHVAMTQVASAHLTLIASQTLTWFRSSKEAERGFCGACGGNLFWRPIGGSTTSIAAGTLDGPTHLKIAEHIFVDDKSDYYEIPDAAADERRLSPFHLAFPVDDLAAARRFYAEVLGCAQGRSAADWIDFDLFGHQIVAHHAPAAAARRSAAPATTAVDGHDVPVPHFGVVLPPAAWQLLAERVRRAGVTFIIEPHTRFAGEVGEQSTMFFRDPAGNALEFKSFADLGQLFATAPPR